MSEERLGRHNQLPRSVNIDFETVNQDAQRGNAPLCVSCEFECPWGSGHQVQDKDTGELVWLCCRCFERETLAAFKRMKNRPPAGYDPDWDASPAYREGLASGGCPPGGRMQAEKPLTPSQERERNYRQWGGDCPTAGDPFDDPVR